MPAVGSILHPTDFSRASDRAFAHALAIALVWQTEFTILHVGPEKESSIKSSRFPPVRQTLERWRLLEAGSPRSAVFEEYQVRVRKIAVRSRHPLLALADFLDSHPTNLIVVATKRRKWLSRWINRSDAGTMARWTGTKTLFVPAGAKRRFVSLDGDVNLKKILVPVNREPDCTAALEMSRRLAEVLGDGPVAITLLHVGDSDLPMPTLVDGPDWSWHRELRQGNPVTEILSAAERQAANLIVMSTSTDEGVSNTLRSGMTEQVIRYAPCPLLVVPAPAPFSQRD
ncbi:MAG: universal stress protein [Gammaproteobacteria bacterium]|nr:universal stress protein [Gammaproteobacteria bacterium]